MCNFTFFSELCMVDFQHVLIISLLVYDYYSAQIVQCITRIANLALCTCTSLLSYSGKFLRGQILLSVKIRPAKYHIVGNFGEVFILANSV